MMDGGEYPGPGGVIPKMPKYMSERLSGDAAFFFVSSGFKEI